VLILVRSISFNLLLRLLHLHICRIFLSFPLSLLSLDLQLLLLHLDKRILRHLLGLLLLSLGLVGLQ
jgi:hypothetical protein